MGVRYNAIFTICCNSKPFSTEIIFPQTILPLGTGWTEPHTREAAAAAQTAALLSARWSGLLPCYPRRRLPHLVGAQTLGRTGRAVSHLIPTFPHLAIARVCAPAASVGKAARFGEDGDGSNTDDGGGGVLAGRRRRRQGLGRRRHRRGPGWSRRRWVRVVALRRGSGSGRRSGSAGERGAGATI